MADDFTDYRKRGVYVDGPAQTRRARAARVARAARAARVAGSHDHRRPSRPALEGLARPARGVLRGTGSRLLRLADRLES